jgi:hypothetical protein
MWRSAVLFIVTVLLGCPSAPASARCVGIVMDTEKSGDRDSIVCASDHIEVPDGRGTTYRVGPEQPYKSVGGVPWYRLEAGDTVYIHYSREPYREKVLISGRGRPDQWIRILGVPGPNGELPVISGDRATTSKNVRFRWEKPDLIEWLGVVHIAVGPEMPENPHPEPPAYIEIANLQIQDGYQDNSFHAGDGTLHRYSGFAACIYARSVQHLVVRNTVLTNCGQGFYNWTGDGSSRSWWVALQTDTVLSGNYIYNNGNSESYLEHQVYTESDRVTIEYNRFGPQRSGARGSQIKDRSAGTVIRYNTIEQSPEGWDIDLVEPEESRTSLGQRPYFKQTFVYGNLISSRGVKYPNIVHWNEDHQAGQGRATDPDGRLFFYHNTVVIVAERDGAETYSIFNATWGGYECPDPAPQGVIDVRNNIFAVLPAQIGGSPPPVRLGYCKTENITLGKNWISPGVIRDGNVKGWPNVIAPANNDPGFRTATEFRLKDGALAASAGSELAPDLRNNTLGSDVTPKHRFLDQLRLGQKTNLGPGSGLGAF